MHAKRKYMMKLAKKRNAIRYASSRYTV